MAALAARLVLPTPASAMQTAGRAVVQAGKTHSRTGRRQCRQDEGSNTPLQSTWCRVTATCSSTTCFHANGRAGCDWQCSPATRQEPAFKDAIKYTCILFCVQLCLLAVRALYRQPCHWLLQRCAL